MKIKRFVAQDMRQALRMVREALGEDAVILSNKSVEGGIELTAAVDLVEDIDGTSAPRRISRVRGRERNGRSGPPRPRAAASPRNRTASPGDFFSCARGLRRGIASIDLGTRA